MQFNSNSDSQDIVSQTLFLCNTDITGYTAKEIARNSNEALGHIAALIFMADGRMQWDDVNHGNQPIATFNLENGVGAYSIFKAVPDGLQDWLAIERVDILDEDGNGYKLDPIDHRDIERAVSEFQDIDSIPRYFDMNGAEFHLYPKPNYDKTAGVTIYFKRAPSYYISTDTTKRAGFASIFRDYVPKYNAMQWFFAHGKMTEYKNLYVELHGNNPDKIGGKDKRILDFYSRRNRQEKPRITRRRRNYV